VDRRYGGDAERVALTAPYGHPLVERVPLGGFQLGGAEEVGDLAPRSYVTRPQSTRRRRNPWPQGQRLSEAQKNSRDVPKNVRQSGRTGCG
jgi:hypothetical protein